MAGKCDERKRRRCITGGAQHYALWPSGKLSSVHVDHLAATKRRPFGLTKKKTNCANIYVTKKTPFKAQLVKCEKFFDAGASEVIIHGLGAAINRACNLALQLKEIHHGSVDFDIRTATANLTDDYEPINDEADYQTKSRNNSVIHIRVFRKALISTIKYAK